MSDCLDLARPVSYEDTLQRLRRAAAGNAGSPDGVTLVQVLRRDVPVAAVLTLTITWVTDVETHAGTETMRSATLCRNAAELDATLARDLGAEAASLETARRLAALIGPPEGVFGEDGGFPTLRSMRGPYYVHEACRSCSGGGVRACTSPECQGGKGVLRCPVCAGAGVVPCDDCAGIGQYTHIHRPRLVVKPARSFSISADAPAVVGAMLGSGGLDGFEDLAEAQTCTLRHSGTDLLYERAGTVPVVTLSCVCDGVCFDVEAVGPHARVPAMPAFLDGVLAPILARIQATANGAEAFAIAATFRVTGAVAEAVLAGKEPDLDAIVADHEHCVSRAFVAQTATVLQRAHRTAELRMARRAWQYGSGALALILLLVATVDLPALLTGATAEEPAPLPLRMIWDIGLPLLAGLGVWLVARDRMRRTLSAAFGRRVTRPTAQGAWPVLVLSVAGVLYLSVMTAWYGGLATDRIAVTPDITGVGAPSPPPRILSPVERITAAQRALARLGRYDGAIDGKLGEGTRTGLAGLSSLMESAAGDPLDLAVAIASDRVGIRLPTPDLLVGPGWSNATRLRITADDQPRVAEAFLSAVATAGASKEWTSSDGMRSGLLTVTGRVEDPQKRQRPCVAFAHVVTTPAGRDAGVPARACRSAGKWSLEE